MAKSAIQPQQQQQHTLTASPTGNTPGANTLNPAEVPKNMPPSERGGSRAIAPTKILVPPQPSPATATGNPAIPSSSAGIPAEVGAIESRKSLITSSFIFNQPRNELLTSIVNNYLTVDPSKNASASGSSGGGSIDYMQSTGHQGQSAGGGNGKSLLIDSNFATFYRRDSSLNPIQNFQLDARPRGDSIYLPPPIREYEQSLQQLQPPLQALQPLQHPQLNSRSNSMFNALIQIPGSNQNSISSQSAGLSQSKSNSLSNATGGNAFSAGGNALLKSRLPSLGGEFSFNPQDFDFGPGGSISWPSQVQSLLLQPKSKRQSVDNAVWDRSEWESIVGLPLSNESFNSIVAGVTSGNIQLSGSNLERRDSVLKYLNGPPAKQSYDRGAKSASVRAELREDIFDKGPRSKYDSNRQSISGQQAQQGGPLASSACKLSTQSTGPLGSIGGSNSAKDEEGQSPKTSPSGFNIDIKPLDLQRRSSAVMFQRGAPQYVDNSGYGAPATPNNYSYNPKYQPQQQQQPAKLLPKKGGHALSSQKPNQTLVPTQQLVQAEDGRPLLGATKIDQLMLVIQARDNGVDSAIPQSEDGSILANPDVVAEQSLLLKPVAGLIPLAIGLVGGIDKPMKQPKYDDLDGTDEPSKRRTKDFQCSYCFKRFSQATHLEVHVRSHIGYKPFECSYCHKRFTQGGNLRTHMRLHTGEKPFTCDQCNKSFSRKGNLAAHLLTHKNEKPYECKLDGCDKAFTQLGNLKSHQNRFHLEALNTLTHRLAELTGNQLNNLPSEEKELLEYFKELYKNSNKGIRGRGKTKNQSDAHEEYQTQPQLGGLTSLVQPSQVKGVLVVMAPPQHHHHQQHQQQHQQQQHQQQHQQQQHQQQQHQQHHQQQYQSQHHPSQPQQSPGLYIYDLGYKRG